MFSSQSRIWGHALGRFPIHSHGIWSVEADGRGAIHATRVREKQLRRWTEQAMLFQTGLQPWICYFFATNWRTNTFLHEKNSPETMVFSRDIWSSLGPWGGEYSSGFTPDLGRPLGPWNIPHRWSTRPKDLRTNGLLINLTSAVSFHGWKFWILTKKMMWSQHMPLR